METSKMKAIMQLMAENQISALKYKTKDETLELTRGAVAQPAQPAVSAQPVAAQPEKPATSAKTINAKFVGVFYTAGNPDDAPFVQVGDTVKAGQTVAVIEAMKMMNNVVATEAGRITKVLAANEDLVEYDQPLFEFESL
ncbi:acetyl-CoA carboxylase biotin carboxyl carrier protein [Secundilactobacillus silagei]|nr:acetyl-CoA carboxylase biotin carboxyl carrier protein subunit [Secundilactobacillus silagei]